MIAAGLACAIAVAATTPSQARWYGRDWGWRPPIEPGPGAFGYTIPPNFAYIGPSVFTGAPVYVAPCCSYGYAWGAYPKYRYSRRYIRR
jgi:hypothetical protein